MSWLAVLFLTLATEMAVAAPVKLEANLHDLNGDGVVNVLDAVRFRMQEAGRVPENVASRPFVGGEQVVVEPLSMTVGSGTQVAVLFLLRSNSTPLVGYTLDVELLPLTGVGSVTPDATETNYYPSQNVIIQGGATLDPVFSVIQSDGSGGVAITALSDDLVEVTAVDGINDAFAEVVLDMGANAVGEFLLTLGPSSAISDENGFAIPFTYVPGTITVVAAIPAVSTWGVLIFGEMLVIVGTVIMRRMGVAAIA